MHAEDFRGLDLSATLLMTRSVCNGGLVRFGADEEPLGLLAAGFVAGVRTIIAPLWPVDDTSTCLEMVALYEGHQPTNQPTRCSQN